MKSVLILQGELSEYRRPVFNRLAQNYRVTVLHGGKPGAKQGDGFAEIAMPVRKMGPLVLVDRGTIENARSRHDVTIAMFDLRWPAYWLPVLRRPRSRFIVWGHRYSGNKLTDALRNALMRRADRILLYGDEELDRVIASGVDPQGIVIAPNTIDVPNHEDLSAAQKSSILYVGRLQERKRLDLAIEAFARIQDRLARPVGFDIVGAGPPEDQLRNCAREHGVEDLVRFHGPVVRAEHLKPFFARAVAYLSPGPVGLAVLHSFAYGVPVLTLREGRHGPEFHNMHGGVNSLIADDEAMLETLLLDLCNRPQLAARLGQAAHQYYATSRTLDHMIVGMRKAIDG